jgi:hypothetical protein
VGLAQGPAVIDDLSDELGGPSVWAFGTNNVCPAITMHQFTLLYEYKNGVEGEKASYIRWIIFLKIALIVVPLICILFGYRKGKEQAEYL